MGERLKEAGSKKAEIEFEVRLDRADNGIGATTSDVRADRASEQELERLYAELHRRMAGKVESPTAANTRGFEPRLPLDYRRSAPPLSQAELAAADAAARGWQVELSGISREEPAGVDV